MKLIAVGVFSHRLPEIPLIYYLSMESAFRVLTISISLTKNRNSVLVNTFMGNCPKRTKDIGCHGASYTSLFFCVLWNIYNHAEKLHWAIFHFMIHSCSYQNVRLTYIVNDVNTHFNG